MKEYIKHDEWSIIEEGFVPEYNKISESIFSIGNGRMGQRANFEENYSGDTLQGSYVAGVYYPDKTRVGWWKNGYPEYFAKVLNAPSWIGIDLKVAGNTLDFAKWKVMDFRRELNMREGYLHREATVEDEKGRQLKIDSKRICSLTDPEIGAIRYTFTPINFSEKVEVNLSVDADVMNEDSNYDEKFWDEVTRKSEKGTSYVVAKTKKTDFHVATGMKFQVTEGSKVMDLEPETHSEEKLVSNSVNVFAREGVEYSIYKYAAVISSEYHGKKGLGEKCTEVLERALRTGFDVLVENHKNAWANKWEESDIVIEGDVAAQQGIRFNIFQLNQTYTGQDERLNIGPKGFTGEKYGGSTYWDTEAYCIPFYLSTAEEKVSRNLLKYRYKHLERAIENARKLGFTDGAALYPMVTMNGEECHNEWEITFEEIHRNGAIAFAIYDYTNYTGDEEYLKEYGLEVLIGISRFWAQRVNWSNSKNQYVMLGVTGPNEYENNVNNNWYTNTIAVWTLKYTLESMDKISKGDPAIWKELSGKLSYDKQEGENWKDITEKMYYPEDSKRGIFLQQDGFLDKEIIKVQDLEPSNLPLNQNWSWDRILRSCFIKQADVLQGIYFLEDHFDLETIKRNYDFYEPLTVHESSLSPCVHVILASKLGYREQAYQFYLRTARLDLDDYNNDTVDGCHTTSMAGTWMSFTKGFGGMRVKEGKLHLHPYIPEQWSRYDFSIRFRGSILHVAVDKNEVVIRNTSDKDVEVTVYNNEVMIESEKSNTVSTQ
jgi:maltose phosphorylase